MAKGEIDNMFSKLVLFDTHSTMTMEELLESLTKKAKLEAEESHRLLIAAINGQAGLCIIQEQVS